MITYQNGTIILSTAHTSYMFRTMETGHLEHLYYGKKLHFHLESAGENFAGRDRLFENAVRALAPKHANLNGCAIAYDKQHPNLCMNDINLEVSAAGTGDMRTPFMELIWADGSSTADMLFESYEIMEGKHQLETLPCAYAEDAVPGGEATAADSSSAVPGANNAAAIQTLRLTL